MYEICKIYENNYNNKLSEIYNPILKSLQTLFLKEENLDKDDLKYWKILPKVYETCMKNSRYFYYYFICYLHLYISTNKLYICNKKDKFRLDYNLETLFYDIKLLAFSKNTILIINNKKIVNRAKLYDLSFFCLDDDDDKNKSYENIINKIIQLFYKYLPIENINEILSYLNKFRIISI